MPVLDAPTRLTSGGVELDLSPDAFGWLRDSTDAAHDADELRARMDADGYLFLPGFLDRDDVRAVRRAIATRFHEEGLLKEGTDLEEMVARPGVVSYFRPDVANDDPRVRAALGRVIYGERILSFYERYYGAPVRHYTFTWLRAIAHGGGTFPHCDVVYMGRGTHRLATAWVPLTDVDLDLGGLIVLEGSHRRADLLGDYWATDVDTRCTNAPGSTLVAGGYEPTGSLLHEAAEVRRRIGGRYLTAREFRMGDLLTFSCYTLHGSLDNRTERFRVSSDSRYQRADEPADERWVGEAPPGHGGAMVRDLIC